MLLVLDANAPPYVWCFRNEPEFAREKKLHPFCALRQHLENMPIGHFHNAGHRYDVLSRNSRMKEITHRVNKHDLGGAPLQRFTKLLRYEAKVKTKLVGVSLHTPKAFSERLRITMLAPRTDFCAAPERIPSRIVPFIF